MYITEKDPRETGREYALRTIKENIISLDLEPGSKVSEKELSLELNLSRTPVREALLELSKVKIVEILPQKGSFVAMIDYSMVEEARFIRDTLECAVVELDCRMATESDLRMLAENLKLQGFYLENHMIPQLLTADNAFHYALFSIANKPQAYTLMTNISIHFDRVRNMSLSTVIDIKIVSDHRAIFEDIAHKDPEAAKRDMEKHLSRFRFDAKAIRAKYPSYFKQETDV